VPPSSNLWTNNNIHEHTPGMIDLKKNFLHLCFSSLFSNTTSNFIFCFIMLNSTSYSTILYTNSYTNINTSTGSSSCDTSSNWWCIFYSTIIALLGS
jgi:hypothetical protein